MWKLNQFYHFSTRPKKSVSLESVKSDTKAQHSLSVVFVGAFIKINKKVTRGDALPEIFQFQVKSGLQVSMTMKSRVTKTEDSALASLREKVSKPWTLK